MDQQDQDLITRFETLLAHHEKQIAELSDVVFAQGRDIDILKRRLELTQDKISRLETALDGREGLSVTEQAALDKPPHY